jgi:cadherin EGF LAG seven-pass G-type receptor 1
MVNENIDFEDREKYELVVEAWDGKYKDTARMEVTVEDENDNNPTFETKLYKASVEENSRKGTFVTTLKAIDPDALPIKYELSVQITNVFKVDPDTGDIVTNAVLDREVKDIYTFEAYARDHGGRIGTVKVTVHVTDQNDNAPIFLRKSLKLSVFENAPRGSVVGKVEATDRDDVISGNGRLSYGIAVDPGHAFTIDRITGVLKLSRALNRENCSMFTLTVSANDHGIPSKSTHDDVIITVLDVNDHSPRFSQEVYEKTIAEDAKIGLSILQLAASDGDIGVNADLR